MNQKHLKHLPQKIVPSVLFFIRFLLIVALVAPTLPVNIAYADGSLPPPPPVRDARFGSVQAYAAPDIASAAGVGWTRVIFWWHQMQRTGRDDWNHTFFPDKLVAQELAAGRRMVGIVLGTAPWASESGSVRAVPKGLYLPFDHPDNLWGQFMFKLARHYAGRIDHWIIWNEPDIWDDAHPGKSWDGSLEDYVQLLRVGYQAAKAANPNAVIHLAATTYWWDAEYGRPQYISRLLKAIRAHPQGAALNGFFDVASLHIYFNPEVVYNVTAFFRRELDQHGFAGKPLWINEMNAPPSEDPHHPAPGLGFKISLEDQAFFLIQGWAMGLAAGADRISLYKTRDDRWLPVEVEPYGMSRLDGSLRPVFWSYRTLVTYLARYREAKLTRDGPLRRVVLPRGELGRTTIVWNASTEPQPARVPASSARALLVDPFGPVETITPKDGHYSLVLPPSRGHGIGGRPYLVVEGAGMHLALSRPESQPPVKPQQTLPSSPLSEPGQKSAGSNRTKEGCLHFTQTTGNRGAFSVCDDHEARFRTAFERWGLARIGYPISRRYRRDGFVTQAFQKGIMQWRPEQNRVSLVNIFDELHRHGQDERLLEHRQTPKQLPAGWDGDLTFEQIVARRQALLEARPALRDAYFASNDPLTFYGLPTSAVVDMGNHYAIRLQRAVLQEWKEDVPWARAGQVTIANGGAVAKELGTLPAESQVPERYPAGQ